MLVKLALIVLIAAAAPKKSPPRAMGPLIDEADLGAAGLVKYWEAHLPLAQGDRAERGYLLDEALYVTTEAGNAFALKADVGLLRWTVNLTDRDYTIFAPTHVRRADGAGPVIFPTTTGTFVFDRFSGELIDRFTPEFATGTSAVAYDHYLFMGSTGGKFYALIFNDPRLTRPMVHWEVLVRGPVTAAPVLYDRRNLLIASQGGVVVSCRAQNKAFNWSYEAGGPILGDPAVDGGGVYVASLDRSLYKLNKATGRKVWQVRFPRPLDAGPIVAGGAVFQFCPGEGITAVDADSGKERWRHKEAREFGAHGPAGDVLVTSKGTVDIVDHETGAVRSSILAPAVLHAVPNPDGQAVYLIAGDGRVLALQLDTVPYLRRQQIMAARKQLNLPPADESAMIKPPPRPATETDPLDDDPLRSRRDVNPKNE